MLMFFVFFLIFYKISLFNLPENSTFYFYLPDSLIAFILKDPALSVSCFLSHKHGLADQSVLLR